MVKMFDPHFLQVNRGRKSGKLGRTLIVPSLRFLTYIVPRPCRRYGSPACLRLYKRSGGVPEGCSMMRRADGMGYSRIVIRAPAMSWSAASRTTHRASAGISCFGAAAIAFPIPTESVARPSA